MVQVHEWPYTVERCTITDKVTKYFEIITKWNILVLYCQIIGHTISISFCGVYSVSVPWSEDIAIDKNSSSSSRCFIYKRITLLCPHIEIVALVILPWLHHCTNDHFSFCPTDCNLWPDIIYSTNQSIDKQKSRLWPSITLPLCLGFHDCIACNKSTLHRRQKKNFEIET